MRPPMTAAHSRHRHRTAMNEDDDESPAKCRERRQRRIEMRRMAMAGPSSLSASPASTGENPSATDDSDRKRIRTEGTGDPTSSGDDVEALAGPSSAGRFPVPVQVPAAEVAPVFGTMSVAGRSRDMEDAILVRTNLCRPDFNRRLPVHFFAVYDGHGGTHVAGLCRDKMHSIMEEELMLVGRTGFGSGCSSSSSREAAVERWVKAAMKRCFARMDEVALNTCACGSMGYDCECHPMEMALSGSTAVVAILTANNIFVANCGDSRAVLCRGGRAVPLSYDHKPDRPDEYARIQACGGRVIFLNGARVEGILAMSRALGDKYLKPIVISEPEISITDRDPEDECLILASDGLWDVLSNDLACEIASECLREGSPPAAPRMQEDEGAAPAFYPSRSASAAALLTRLALGRRSADNISVIVVDLKRN